MDLRSAVTAAGCVALLGAAVVVLSRYQPEPAAETAAGPAPSAGYWPKYGPCPHPDCGRGVEELIRHYGVPWYVYRTVCGHLVQEIPEAERVDNVWKLKLYTKRRR